MSVRISKFLSYVLRHNPGQLGITLDEAGWTDVGGLLSAVAARGVAITREELRELVASSDKQRFALSPDGERIRANQGHSVGWTFQLPPREPPAVLYHGTVERALEGIREHGLLRGTRHHVHLSPDVPTAKKVGFRRGAPVILTVRAADMHAAGLAFYCSENGVWLTDRVPPRFIEIPPPKGAGNAARGAKVKIAKQTLDACEAGTYRNAAGQAVSIREAIDAARRGTVAHDLAREELAAVAGGGAPMRITVTVETTIEALVRLAREPGGALGCLNFASAKNPGGGFLSGAQAQEEALARSSALYPCLVTQKEHYDRNRASGTALYLDLAIFSPRVPFFRDDHGGWLDQPVLASVITCAAPNAGALCQHRQLDQAVLEETLHRRAAFVLAIAAHHGVRRLVLGAWGAGVFRNDPEVVAAAFRAPLSGAYAGAFDEVVFAVPPGPNLLPFEAAFGASAATGAAGAATRP